MNKYKLLDKNGKHLVGQKSTGWAFTDAVMMHKCEKCGSEPGYHCESPSGRKVWPPHSARVVVTEEHKASIDPISILVKNLIGA